MRVLFAPSRRRLEHYVTKRAKGMPCITTGTENASTCLDIVYYFIMILKFQTVRFSSRQQVLNRDGKQLVENSLHPVEGVYRRIGCNSMHYPEICTAVWKVRR